MSSSSKKDIDFLGEECSNCGKTSKLLSCARCRIQKYCSETCQRQHWKAICGHKKFCIPIGERKKDLPCDDFLSRADKVKSLNCCSICIDAISSGPYSDTVVLQTCRHAFHVKCFQLFMESENNDRCPNCRGDIDFVQVFEKNTVRSRHISNLFQSMKSYFLNVHLTDLLKTKLNFNVYLVLSHIHNQAF